MSDFLFSSLANIAQIILEIIKNEFINNLEEMWNNIPYTMFKGLFSF